jgi:hypothetical protein
MRKISKQRLFLKPNIIRGLFRVWLILSVLWIGYGVYFSMNTIVFFDAPDDWALSERFKASQDDAIKKEEEYEIYHNYALDSCLKIFISASAPIEPNSCFGKEVRLGQFQIKYLDEHDMGRSSLKEYLPKYTLVDRFVDVVWMSFVKAIALCLLPPLLAIFIFGCTRWIVVGFIP